MTEKDVTVRMMARADENGVLRLEIHLSKPHAEVEITIVSAEPESEPIDRLGWPVGFFEETYGAFADNPIERQPQGEPEVRDTYADRPVRYVDCDNSSSE